MSNETVTTSTSNNQYKNSFSEPYSLTQEQLASFEKDGYLLLSDLIPLDMLKQVQLWSFHIQSLPNDKGKWMHYEEVKKDGSRTLCRTENFVNYHQGFNLFLRGQRIRRLLEQLSGEEMLLFKEKINYKNPGAGGFDAHTDAPAYQHSGALKHLTINVAVDAATTENGCLEVVDGSHKMEVEHDENNCISKDWEKSHTWKIVPLSPGDVLIFGSFLAHRSGPNFSSKPRAAIYATYNAMSDGGDKHDEYYVDRRQHWPPTSEREEGKDYKLGAFRYGYGSPMDGAQKHSRMIMEQQA